MKYEQKTVTVPQKAMTLNWLEFSDDERRAMAVSHAAMMIEQVSRFGENHQLLFSSLARKFLVEALGEYIERRTAV